MGESLLVDRAFEAFATDLASPPPLSLRGGSDVDSYRRPASFDVLHDEPTDDYFEGYAFWGLIYLDAQSWRHYIPHLIAYAARHPDDPHMVVEALIRSLRPPDRYPPRLATLTQEQEDVLIAFLASIAADHARCDLRDEAQAALEEWWLPNPRSRPTPTEIAALRNAPVSYRTAGSGRYCLEVPVTLTGSGVRDIPEESRRVEVWGGYLCGDAHTVIAINSTPLSQRSFEDSITFRRQLFRDDVSARSIAIPGASRAERIDGLSHGDSPAEPHMLTVVLAATRDEIVTLTVQTWPREDLAREVERIVHSFTLDTG
jgi:hypothetical protein